MIKLSKKILVLGGLAVLFALACLFWAFCVEPNRLCVTRERLVLDAWSGNGQGAKILVAGDFHFAPNDDARARKIVNAILEEAPDAVFLLGDYVNGHTRKSTMAPEAIARHLGRLTEHFPVFAVLGNHDAYAGRRAITKAFREVGIRVFDEKGVQELCLPGGRRLLVGGTLDAHSYFPVFDADEIPENPSSGTLPLILLSHSPDVLPFLNAGADLTLCGHTHGGQLCLPGGWPIFNSCRVVGNDFVAGMKTVPQSGKAIFITRGLGTSILPARFFCPPELVVIELQPAGPAKE